MEINFAIDFKIIFVASYIVNTEFIFEYFYDNGINLPTYLPVNRQENEIIFLRGMRESTSLMMEHRKKVALFYLCSFCLFLKNTQKRKGKFPKN